MDRKITIEAIIGESQDDYGTTTQTWESTADLRCGIVQASTEEFLRGYGDAETTVIVFRTRYLAGLTTLNRIKFEGDYFDIRELKEIGRRKGWEIRCERMRT